MANKFGLGSLSLETKKPNTTAWINKAKPYFLDQIGDTLQGDLDMNNFSITNLKSLENDNDAIHKKYLMQQLNLIEVNKDHLKERINDVKRFFKRQMNNKDFIDDTKLQQEVKVDSLFFTQGLSRHNNKFNAKKVLQFINGTKNVETKEYESNDENNKLHHLYEIKTSGKYIDRLRMLIIQDKEEDEFILSDFDMILETETPPSMNIIRNPEPQKDISFYEFLRATDFEYVKLYFVDNDKDTFQQELNALETKLNSELQKELTNIHQQIQNIDDSVIQQQINTINNLVLKQDKNIVALEKKKESYYFNLPFGNLRDYDASITDNIDKSKDYGYKKYGFTANIRVYSVPNYTIHPKNIFDPDAHKSYQPIYFDFRGKLIIEITFSFQVKVDSLFFTQGFFTRGLRRHNKKFNAKKVLQFINGTKNVETKEYESNDENNKLHHLYEIKTSGKYIDRFRMLIIQDKEEDEYILSDFDMILETETPPSMNIIRNPEPQKKI
ncbi:hypothetical protein LOTGIDRAFT_174355 [Lottia gigantea]|uniref:Uncharacterized protein n=1 Tax=Lottia gigantea TaxID=225164 RepID=V4C8M5_LOTGI|nr:hypothetical protein LOTGIDRAFT_174355 [Lottia gigantea]ESO98099.1 hypothetical protein LOTGIDRAFT_174355 [Lottia gigantea]